MGAMSNLSQVVEFELCGFQVGPRLRGLLLPLFLVFYALALGGNTLIVTAIALSSALHTPMYFFLVNLSVLDVACTSAVVPKLLAVLAGGPAGISYGGCMAQMFFLSWAVASEVLLFTAMALDRYMAICHPLRYGTLMRPAVCGALATGVWALGWARGSTRGSCCAWPSAARARTRCSTSSVRSPHCCSWPAPPRASTTSWPWWPTSSLRC